MSSNTSPLENSHRTPATIALLLSLVLFLPALRAADPQTAPRANRQLADYFTREVASIDSHPLAEPTSAEQWETTRAEMKRQLAEMLGLDPMPERTPLKVVKTGEVKGKDSWWRTCTTSRCRGST